MQATQVFDWEELMIFLEDGRVIPVVGPDLHVLQTENGPRTLYKCLAEQLAQSLQIPDDQCPPDYDLNWVAGAYLRNHGDRRKLYSRLRQIVERSEFAIPEPLIKLAQIPAFKLFVTTTFDSLLNQAVDSVRFGGEPRTEEFIFSPNRRLEDLPGEIAEAHAPIVFRLFGKQSSLPDYVVTDEDMLEFLHVLQSPDQRPQLLFDELKDHHLLILGCSYPDWLARFFVRTVTNERLSALRDHAEIIADDCTIQNSDLVLFLKQYQTEVFEEPNAIAFVDELHRQWTERHPVDARPDPPVSQPSVDRAKPAFGSDSIFLSYASEDRGVVQSMKEALESIGLDVWFDQRDIESGEDWEYEIRRNIRNCLLFVPLITENAMNRLEGVFRKEWRWAIDRAAGMDDSIPFVQPVGCLVTPDQAKAVPEYFLKRNWQTFPDGKPTVKFVERMQELVRQLRLIKAGRI